jgi:hypothetical protein
MVDTPLPQSLVREFRLSSLAEEFENHSRAEIERLRTSQSDFDERPYQEAVALVLRKLSQRESRDLP